MLYYCGGKTLYDLSARTRVKGNTVVLTKELKTVDAMSYNLKRFADNVGNFDSVGSEDFRMVRTLCDQVSESYFLSVLASDLISGAANKWVKGEDFMGYDFPISNETLDPMFDSILHVFASTTYQTVAVDVATFIDICTLAIDTGLADLTDDYDALMEILNDGTVIDRLTAILESNPRMANVTDTLYRTAMKSLVKTIKFDGYDPEEYQGLINDITDQLNRLQGQKVEKKVETLTDYAVDFIRDYGVDVPETVAEMIVSAMIKEIPADDTGYVDPVQITQFFDKYYTSGEIPTLGELGE